MSDRTPSRATSGLEPDPIRARENPAWAERLVGIATVCLFAGLAWQHLRWDAPLWALVWNEPWLRPVIEDWFGGSWDAWVTSERVEGAVLAVLRAEGAWLAAAAVAAALWPRVAAVAWARRTCGVLIVGGAVLVALWGVLDWLDHNRRWPQLCEHGIQAVLPWLWWSRAPLGARGIRAARVAIGLTFVGHGVYALGWWPRPGSFVTMTMNSLGVEQTTAEHLLLVAGAVDLFVAVAIWLPRCALAVLWWAAAWGLLTAVARPWAHLDFDRLPAFLAQWLHPMAMRLGHGLLPAALALALRPSGSGERRPPENVPPSDTPSCAPASAASS